MLFNSYVFIFLFLPISLVIYGALARFDRRWATLSLAAASLFFYGWWNPSYLWLLCLSILFNFGVGRAIAGSAGVQRRRFLVIGIAGDLLVLFYFKYFNFLVGTLAGLVGLPEPSSAIVLPIGISFFTFTQIAFLVDMARGDAPAYDFLRYVVFVTFFPHLLAGPLYHHREIMPQFAAPAPPRARGEDLAVGLTIFVIGLFKKVVLADGIAFYAAPVFDAAAGGGNPTLVEAWGGALAYGFQLYYDFSGYSDMAIGAARWQPARRRAALRQPVPHHAARRALARRRLDLRRMGRASRTLPDDQPRVAGTAPTARLGVRTLRTARPRARRRAHLHRRSGCVGSIPRDLV